MAARARVLRAPRVPDLPARDRLRARRRRGSACRPALGGVPVSGRIRPRCRTSPRHEPHGAHRKCSRRCGVFPWNCRCTRCCRHLRARGSRDPARVAALYLLALGAALVLPGSRRACRCSRTRRVSWPASSGSRWSTAAPRDPPRGRGCRSSGRSRASSSRVEARRWPSPTEESAVCLAVGVSIPAVRAIVDVAASTARRTRSRSTRSALPVPSRPRCGLAFYRLPLDRGSRSRWSRVVTLADTSSSRRLLPHRRAC